MTLLSKVELTELILRIPSLVENMIDPELQIQPNGVEMTLKQVEILDGVGEVDFDNSGRKIPDSRILEFGSDRWIHLPKGCYKVLFNEIVNIPKYLAATANPGRAYSVVALPSKQQYGMQDTGDAVKACLLCIILPALS